MTYSDGKIHEGWASIKEDGLKSLYWTKKYLILREISLDFHKNESSTSMSLSIPLKDIVSVNRTDLKPYCFEVIRMASSQQGMSSDAPRRTVFVSVKSDQDLYAWIDEVYSRCPSMGGVSNPTNFTHKVHVGFDPVSGGFTGLPEEWSKLLNSSAITKEDYQKNPQAVIEVLEFYTEGQQRLNQTNGFASMAPTPPATLAAQQKQLAMAMGNQAPGSNYQQDNRDREQWERERERDAYREQEYEKVQREQQAQREKQERERRQREHDRDREQELREREERARDDEMFNQGARQQQDNYDDEDYPQKTSTAQQPIMMGGGGGGGGLSSQGRYNPMAPKTSTSTSRTPQKASNGRDMDPRRPAPSAPGSTLPRPAPGSQRTPAPQQTNLRAPPSRSDQKSPSREPSPSAGARGPVPIATKQPQLQAQTQASRIPSPAAPTVKPLNVPAKPANAAKEVITKQERKETQKRISNMTEAQVMEKLRSVVSPGDPNQSYTKLKKVGQGASGSVYVAKINSSPASSMAASMLSSTGKNTARVAIKQMDLAHQPRKELIVNEILVMKESQHPNIVNFLDAFLKGNSELWVVMEYMEGGALTDVIENNSLEEDQIATICFEVRLLMPVLIAKPFWNVGSVEIAC